jgi:hypothetical protein
MRDKPFLILLVTTIILVVAAWVATVQRAPESELERVPLYPDLLNKINKISRISVRSTDHETRLVNKSGSWILENRGGYPALFEEVKRILVGAAELRIRERKTRRPDRYPRLQVEDLTQENARSVQLTLFDADDDVLADLLVGKHPSSAASRDVSSRYVRRVGDEEALLVDGELELSADPRDWFDSQLVDVETSRLSRMTIVHPNGDSAVIYKDDLAATDFDLLDVPADKEIKSKSLLNSQMASVSNLRFDDVLPAAEHSFPEQAVTTLFETFDGLHIRIASAEMEAGRYSRFDFEFVPQSDTNTANENDSDEAASNVADEAAELNARVEGWLYKLPEFQLTKLTRSKADLLKDKSESSESANQNIDQQLHNILQQ